MEMKVGSCLPAVQRTYNAILLLYLNPEVSKIINYFYFGLLCFTRVCVVQAEGFYVARGLSFRYIFTRSLFPDVQTIEIEGNHIPSCLGAAFSMSSLDPDDPM